MASAVRADEAKMSAVNTALSNTTISGFVDVAAQYNIGDQTTDTVLPPYANWNGKNVSQFRDGFSLNVVDIALDRPLDDSSWAAGYHIELNAGTGVIDGVNPIRSGAFANTSSHVAVRQAYIALRTPILNGIDWKLGVFDGITGYESNTGYKNPNYTRSYAYIINPASFTGLLATYNISSAVSVTLGIANRANYQAFDSSSTARLSSKDYIGAITLTAPESWGWLKGSAFNFGTVQAFDNYGVNNYSANLSLATPVAGLKFGFAWDAFNSRSEGVGDGEGDANIYGLYATYQATDKLSFNLRGELVDGSDLSGHYSGTSDYESEDNLFNFLGKGEAVTATVEYDLWANVTTRLEFRWDHTEHRTVYNGSESANTYPYGNDTQNAYLLAFNAVYKF
jgi:hypothetical protein